MDDRPSNQDDEQDQAFRIFDDEGVDLEFGDAEDEVLPLPGSGSVPLPHWTEPPTGEVPRILRSGEDEGDESDGWSSLSTSQPRWRDQSSGWDDTDLRSITGDLPPVSSAGVIGEDPDRFFSFDDSEAQPEPYSVPRDVSEPYGGRAVDPFAAPRATGSRDMASAVGVGVGLVVIALALASIGPAAAMALVAVILALAVAEFHTTLRRVGYSTPALVGLAAGAAIPLAAYWRGEFGLVLAVMLTLLVALLWYLFGIGDGYAVPNIAVTMLGVVYISVLGSFAALLLRSPDGVGLLIAAIVGPVAHDVAGLFVGSALGKRPLSPTSPNKTVEGTVGGMLAAVVASVVIVGGMVGGGIAPFDSVGDAFLLGVVLAVVSPLGDLCESLLKRDLGVKDMGSILPGHGGLLDRFDAILFALPATYYVAWFALWT